MSEELEIPEVLERLKEFSVYGDTPGRGPNLAPIERVLAAHTGTVQLLLSLWWNEPVDIVLISQSEEDGKIHRVVDLTCRNSHLVAAHAESIIKIEYNHPDVIGDVRAQKLGLGQIAVKHNIQTSRVLHEVQVAPHELSRFYSMKGMAASSTGGPGGGQLLRLHYEIRESFPRVHYR